VGNPGTGKSHLAIALAAEACAKGCRVRFIRTTELVTALIGGSGLKVHLGCASPVGMPARLRFAGTVECIEFGRRLSLHQHEVFLGTNGTGPDEGAWRVRRLAADG